jgi:hypothetical protein
MAMEPEPINSQVEHPADASLASTSGDLVHETDQSQDVSYLPAQNVEDMTLAELIGQLFRAPGETWATLLQVLRASSGESLADLKVAANVPGAGRLSFPDAKAFFQETSTQTVKPEQLAARRREATQLGLRLAALLVALYGSGILAVERTEIMGLNVGAPYLIIAFLLWLASELYGSWTPLVEWWRERGTRRDTEFPEISVMDEAADGGDAQVRPAWLRLSFAVPALLLSILTAVLNANNRFNLLGLLAWFVSIGLWVAVFAPQHWSFSAAWASVRRFRFYREWTFWALVVILLLGGYFRFNQLTAVPPEMTSDHVEKLLDAQSVLDGDTQVFFPNNGGREPIQFYTLALLNSVFGLPLNFLTLKLLSVVEGLLSICVLWWMGREVIGAEDRRLGNVVGLLLAALVAASYWHTSLSRLGLRIILTVVFTALLIIFLSRALRYNRRGDFIKSGLALGFGLYAYQAVRMLPVIVLIGVGLAILFRGIGSRFGRRGEWGLRLYIANLIVLVVISLAVFVPLLTFSLQYPNDFWRRTSGRLLGDDLIQTTDEQGNLIERHPTVEERIEAFQKNWPILTDNIRNALLMYNWKGDVAWINAAPNHPTMDVFSGALLIVGLAAWLARMIRRRDVVDWLMPIMLFVMLLPSALSIAYPIENPSATRTSGTLPEAYLFAAFPLALISVQIMRVVPRRGVVIATGLVVLIVLGAYNANQDVYFNEYSRYYAGSSLPYSDAGKVLRGFADSGGGYGNAFMIAYPYWWDHRAMAIESGDMDWPNGIVTRDDVPRFLYEAASRTDRYQLDPNKDLLFFYSIEDEATERSLKEWFPTGYSQVYRSYQPEDDFKLFRVPALGNSALVEFFVRTNFTE